MPPLLTVKNLQVKFATRNTFVTAVDDFSSDIDRASAWASSESRVVARPPRAWR